MIFIEKIVAVVSGGIYRLTAEVRSSQAALSPIQESVFFELPEQYSDYVNSDSGDCFMLALLYFAMRRGEDLHIGTTVSEQLINSLNSDAIKLIAAYNLRLKPIRISADNTAVFPVGNGAGTGFSGGVDSCYSVASHSGKGVAGRPQLTDLFFFNVGTHGLARTLEEAETTRRKFKTRFEKFSRGAATTGLPYVQVDSNVNSFLPDNVSAAISLVNAACAYLLSRRLGTYYFASPGYNYSQLISYIITMVPEARIDISVIEPALMPLLSTKMQLVADAVEISRPQKTMAIADMSLAQHFLNVCNSLHTVEKNCSECLKCRRTMTDLELLGKLDAFSDVFDVELFRRKFRSRDIANLIYHGSCDHFAAATLDFANSSRIDLRRMTTAADLACAWLNGSTLYRVLRKLRMLETLKGLVGRGQEKKI